MVVLSSVAKAIPIIARYAKGFGKFTSGETAFVSRFPPRHRETVRTIIKGASTVTYGGLISDILKGDDGTDHGDAQIRKNVKYPPSQSRKTRGGRFGRSNKYGKYSRFRNRCRCQNNSYDRKRSTSRKYY